MKLYSIIRVDVAASEILARPGLMARLRAALGGNPDLATGRMRAALEAATVVDAMRQGLAELGATDAVSLVVDDVTLFQDRDRRQDDLGDLFLAFHEYEPAMGEGFRSLRLAVEHREAGVHYVIELQARTEYPKHESPVRVVISGRIAAFEPIPGEDAEAYRARVEPLLQQPSTFELARVSFESFVARARDAIARAMPEARCTIEAPALESRPAPAQGREPGGQRPDDPRYDPHEAYYPNPMLGMLGAAMLGSALMPAWAMAAMGGAPAADAGGEGGGGGDEGDADAGGLFDFDW